MIAGRLWQRDTPFDNPVARLLAGRFGVRLFLISLAMLFAATILGFIVIRVQLHDRWPRDLPGLPHLLWMSTAVLGLSSLAIQWGLAGIRHGMIDRLRIAMRMTLGLAVAFLLLQSASWWTWLGVVTTRWGESSEHRFALTSFYVLTGLHALHVLGGLIPITIVTVRSGNRAGDGRPAYTAASHAGVEYAATYWHFLGVVWIVLYATLLIGT